MFLFGFEVIILLNTNDTMYFIQDTLSVFICVEKNKVCISALLNYQVTILCVDVNGVFSPHVRQTYEPGSVIDCYFVR